MIPMPNPEPAWLRLAEQATAWIATYAVHSTLLLAAAWLATRRLGGRHLAAQETVWKLALVGGIATATLQLGLGLQPLAGSWSVGQPAATAAAPAPAAPAAAPPATSAVARRPVAPTAARDAALPAPRPVARIVDAAAAEAAAEAAARTRARRLLLLAGLGLATLGIAWLAPLGAAYLRLGRRLRGRAEIDGPLLGALRRLEPSARLARPVRLSATPRIPMPIARGLARGEICLPARALSELGADEQEGVVAHELAHLARRDPAWLLVARAVERLFFFQPLNRLARRRLLEISEYRCDDWAAARTGRPLSLARCLTEVAAWRVGAAGRLPVPAIADGSSLGRRVRRLLDGGEADRPAPRWLKPLALAAVAAVAVVGPGAVGRRAAAAPDPMGSVQARWAAVLPAAFAGTSSQDGAQDGGGRVESSAAGERAGGTGADFDIDIDVDPDVDVDVDPDVEIDHHDLHPLVEAELDLRLDDLDDELERSLEPLEEGFDAQMEDLGRELEAGFEGFEDQLEEQMEEFERQMEDLGEQMEQLHDLHGLEGEVIDPDTARRLGELGAQMGAIGGEMGEIGGRIGQAFSGRFGEDFGRRVGELAELATPDPETLERIHSEARRLSDEARRLEAEGRLTEGERARIRAEARAVADLARPDEADLARIHELAAQIEAEAKPDPQEMEALRAELRRTLEQLRGKQQEMQRLQREMLEQQREDLDRQREQMRQDREQQRGQTDAEREQARQARDRAREESQRVHDEVRETARADEHRARDEAREAARADEHRVREEERQARHEARERARAEADRAREEIERAREAAERQGEEREREAAEAAEAPSSR